MDKSLGKQKTMKPAGSDDRSMGGALTLPPRDGARPNADRSLGSVKTMSPGGVRSAGRRFCAGEVILARYRVTEELGQGGMGVVYRCFDTVAGIDVALKALPPEVAHNSGEMEEMRANFRLVSKLHHPNIANVNTLERDAVTGDYYLIMECVDGYDVRQWVRSRKEDGRPLTLDEVTIIAYRIAEALDYAHEQGVIHRDIKPSNVRVNFEGEVKVLDFGLAAQLHTSLSRVSQVSHGTSGTGPYMAPEQWRGRRQGAAADQYALAATVYELLCGTPPFEGHDLAILREAVLKDAPLPLEGVPSHVNAALLRGLEKVPEQRFESCADFVKALAGSRRQEEKGKDWKVEVIRQGVESRESSVGHREPEVGGRGKAWWLVAGVAMVAILMVAGVLYYGSHKAGDRRQKEAAAEQAAMRDAAQKAATERLAVVKAAEEKAVAERQAAVKAAEEKALAETPAVMPVSLVETRVTADGLVPLFNGRDLTGWASEDGDGNCWSVQGDELILNRPENQNSWLLTDADYSDFILKLEFKLGQGGNSGVTLRAEPHEAKHGNDKHLEIQIIDDSRWPKLQLNMKAGSLFGITNDRPAALSPIGNWNEMKIEMRGLSLRVSINGQETVNTRLDGLAEFNADSRLQREKGRIGLQAHGHAAVSFRNIRITELKTANSTAPTTAALASTPSQQSPHPWSNSLSMARAPDAKQTVDVDLGNGLKMEFVSIPRGSITMRSGEVTHIEPFFFAKYKVTQEQWQTLMGNNPSRFKGAKHPVENVNWNDCQGFIKKLQAKHPEWQFALPTRAQWEYAARAGSKNKLYFFGDDVSCLGDYAWYADNSGGTTHPVGQKKPNPWGLYDIHGNLWEWSAEQSPPSTTHHWLKGGSWNHAPGGLKFGSAGNYRGRTDNIGFRVMMVSKSSR